MRRTLSFADAFDRADGALANGWTSTGWVVSGNSAYAAPSSGEEIFTNPEFASDVTGWTTNNVTLTRVDSETDPGVSSGGNDKWCGKFIGTSTSWPSIFVNDFGASAGSWYVFSGRLYQPTGSRAALAVGRSSAIGTMAEKVCATYDAWESLKLTTFAKCILPPTYDMHVGVSGQNAVAVYADALSLKQLTLNTLYAMRTFATADIDLSVQLTIPSAEESYAGLVLCADDLSAIQNGIFVLYNRESVAILKMLNGMPAIMAEVTTAYVAGATLRVVKRSNTFVVSYNGVQIDTAKMVDDVGIINNVNHGMFSTSDTIALNNFTAVVSSAVEQQTYQWGSPDFSLVFMTDLHLLLSTFDDHFLTVMKWIVKMQDQLNIAIVLDGGDTDRDTNAEWDAKAAAFAVLDAAGIPYLVAIGNHDTSAMLNTAGHFPPARYTGQAWWSGGFYDAAKSDNAYLVLTIGGTDYLFLNLDTRTLASPGAAVEAWANGVLTANAGMDAFMVTHYFIDPSGTQVIADLWNNILKLHDNPVLTINGHDPTDDADHTSHVTSGGRTVNELMSDWQFYDDFGSGFVQVLEVYLTSNQVKVYSYSPIRDKFLTSAANQYTLTYKAGP